MPRFVPFVLAAGLLLFTAAPVAGQVVETEPTPPRTDQSVTLYFNADQGDGGLEGFDGDVYVHTGISTNQNPDQAWKCVKNNWPTEDAFTGNRDDTQLTQVAGDPNRYRLEISDIRAYYQDTSTQCNLGSDERIQTMNMVFRNADGSRSGRAEGGRDIFVDVFDVGDEPLLQTRFQSPEADPPLYPFITQNSSVDVTVSADTANVESIASLKLFVDGGEVANTTEDSLTYELNTSTPDRFDLKVKAEASAGGTSLTDSTSTFYIRAPEVQNVSRPSVIQGDPGENDGITYNSDGSVTLSLYAPQKEFVYAIGDFSDWGIDQEYFMNRDGDHWWMTIPASDLSGQEEYDFQYFVDGEIRTSDPFAHKVRTPEDGGISESIYPGLEPYPGDQTENLVSVIRPGQDNSFSFSDFQPPDREDLVVYELLLRDFVEEGSFSVLTDTLDYLDRLGVNAVELLPVANFGGNSSWGYNPNAHLALDKSYGPPQGFKQFVEAAHQRGIAVIMDVVYNHITTQSPLSQLYGSNLDNPFLEPQPGEDQSADRGFCDDFFEELNHGSPFIKNYIDRANEYWIENFNVDGFRFDLAKCVADDGITISEPGYSEAVVSGWKRVADRVWSEVDPNTLMILEFFGTTGQENELGGYSGTGNTAGMMTWYNMNSIYSQADMGYLSGDGGTSDFSSSYFGNRSGYDQASYVSYMESHDEQWLMRRKKAFGNSTEGYSTQNLKTALNRQKLVGGFFFTVPGPKMMWQFGELGYGWGENECLKESDACVASDPGRTAPKPIRWEYRDPETSPDRVRLYKTWSALINLRRSHEVFRSPETDVEMNVADGERTRWIRLSHPSMDALVVGNFGLLQRDASVTFQETGTWYNVFANQAVDIQNTDKTIPLRPGEFRIYTSEQPAVSPESGLVPSTLTPPSRINVDVERSFGAVTDPSNYRLVALPGSTSVPLTEAAFGTPGDTWRAFYDTGAESDYLVEYSGGDDRFTLGKGTGVWLLSGRSFAYEDSVESVSLRENRAQIPLHDGWNIISNPLSLSVDWNRVRADNNVSAPLYRWDNGSFVEADTFQTAVNGEAFYFNNASGLDSLSVPYPGSVADRQAAQAGVPEALMTLRRASTFRLEAETDGTTASVRLGYSEGPTPVQQVAPRTTFSDIRLVAGEESQTLATQVIPTAADSVQADRLSFDLRLSTTAGQPVRLRPKGLDAFTNEQVTLVNRETGETYALASDETVQFTPSSEQTRLRLRVGSIPDEPTQLTPDRVRLYQNYPNPVRRATTVKYDVPEQMSVRLSVYDVLGRRVTTLYDGERSPGQYKTRWTPGASGSLASGVYFVRLEAGDETVSKRITVVR